MDFNSLKYFDYANKVQDAFKVNLEQAIYMIDLMSVTCYTSYALDRNLTWPFVTLPNFEIIGVRAHHLVPTSAAIVFAPVVSGAEREDWEIMMFATKGGRLRQLSTTTLTLNSILEMCCS